jgi:hypothetical protein
MTSIFFQASRARSKGPSAYGGESEAGRQVAASLAGGDASINVYPSSPTVLQNKLERFSLASILSLVYVAFEVLARTY